MSMMDYNNPNEYWQHNPMMKDDQNIDPDEAMKSGCFVCLFYLIAFAVGVLLCALLGSCTTTEYIPVIEHRTDTLIQTKVQHDSIHIHDSIHVTEKGDTVKIEKWHTKYIEKHVHDTTYISKTDTVPQPYPVIKEVEKQLTRRQQIVFTIGIFTIIAAICWFVWWAVKILRRFGIFN